MTSQTPRNIRTPATVTEHTPRELRAPFRGADFGISPRTADELAEMDERAKRELDQRVAPTLRPSVGDELAYPMSGPPDVEFDRGLTFRQHLIGQALANPDLSRAPTVATHVDRIFAAVDAVLARLDDEAQGR